MGLYMCLFFNLNKFAGLGFVGRNLVCYLVEHDLCSKVSNCRLKKITFVISIMIIINIECTVQSITILFSFHVKTNNDSLPIFQVTGFVNLIILLYFG